MLPSRWKVAVRANLGKLVGRVTDLLTHSSQNFRWVQPWNGMGSTRYGSHVLGPGPLQVLGALQDLRRGFTQRVDSIFILTTHASPSPK